MALLNKTPLSPRQLIWRILRLLLIAWLLGAVYLYFFQRDLLYHPSQAVSHPYPVEIVRSSDANLKVIVINRGKPQALLYFGGNAETVALNAAYFQQWLPNHTVYLVNYRGYGGSSGQASEASLLADGLLLYDHYRPRHQQLNVIGRSLGTGVACSIASQRPVTQLVLATPYDSITALAQAKYPIYPINWLLKDHYNSLARAPKIQASTLVLLAEQDNLVPHNHSARLIAALPHARVTTIAGSNHSDITDFDTFYQQTAQFLTHQHQPADTLATHSALPRQ